MSRPWRLWCWGLWRSQPRRPRLVLRGVVYGRASSGGPGALLGRTFQFTVPAGVSARWLVLYLAPPVRLGSGVYWLGLQSGANNGVARFAWDARDNSRSFNVDASGRPERPLQPGPNGQPADVDLRLGVVLAADWQQVPTCPQRPGRARPRR
jgi:hypothetical protein